MLLCVCEKYSYNVYVLSTVSFNRVAAASRTSCSKLSQTTLVCVIPSLCHTSAGDDDLELLSLPPALKEKYIRLQTENRMLNKTRRWRQLSSAVHVGRRSKQSE